MVRAGKTAARVRVVLPGDLPSGLRLCGAYGFIDDYGDRWHWDDGQVVRNPFLIDMLIKRKAPVVVV